MTRIIPAIDIIEGQCVRLSEGDYNRKSTYFHDPLEAAKVFEGAGLQYLHLVDLDGAKSKKIVNLKVLERIASQTNLQIDFGGGVKSDSDLKDAISAGAKQVTCGSIAVQDPERVKSWIKTYGTDTILLGADAKEGQIATHGWLKTSNISLESFLESWIKEGITYSVCTDISKDGMLAGPNFGLYSDLHQRFPNLNLIASGGISNIEDVKRLIQEATVEGIIIGKAIYENKIDLKELATLC